MFCEAKAITTQEQQLDSVRKEIVVAIIDTGIDLHSSYLSQFLWKNTGESGKDKFGRDREKNGIDDDQNGYVDDVFGWDFTNNSSHPRDTNGHGTHVAGLILQNLNQMNIKILPLKYYSKMATGEQNLKRSLSALRYAIDQKVDIINYSGGGNLPSAEEEVLFKIAEKKGISIVAAAGNEGSNNDQVGFYPANYNTKNIITVTAVNNKFRLLNKSNFGRSNVLIAAPGEDISSLGIGGKIVKMSGTSQATGIVTGKLARIMASVKSELSFEEKLNLLVNTGLFNSSLRDKIKFPVVIKD